MLRDALEVIVERAATSNSFSISGNALDIADNQNICLKAYNILREDFSDLPFLKIHLHKQIPSGAGLGGGSADGAFMLKAINELLALNLSKEQLTNYALKLGSDCPFFILNQPALAQGRGELLSPVELDLSAYSILLVNPGIHIPTPWAFSQVQPKPALSSLTEIISQPVPMWKDVLINDFEEPVARAHPEMREIREALYAAGAQYAALSGSGSTVFGLFEKGKQPSLSFPPSYFVFSI